MLQSSSASDSDFEIRKHIPMFGSNLTEIMVFDRAHSSEDVPLVLKHICRALMMKKENFEVKGIFRESVSQDELKDLAEKYNKKNAKCKKIVSLNFQVDELFKELQKKNALFLTSYENYGVMFEVSKMGKTLYYILNFQEIDKIDPKKALWVLEKMISSLEPIHRNVLNVLLYILYECDKVNDLTGQSKMNAENLAKVMTLNLTRKEKMTLKDGNDIHLLINTTYLMIVHYPEILKTDEDLFIIRKIFSGFTYDDRFNTSIEEI
eukprot:gene11019-3725_t